MGALHNQGSSGRLCWATETSRRGSPAGRLGPIGRTDKPGASGAVDICPTGEIFRKTVNSASSGPDAKKGGDHASSCGDCLYHPVGWQRSEATRDSLNLRFPRSRVGQVYALRNPWGVKSPWAYPSISTNRGRQKVCLAERRQPWCWLACLPAALAATSLKIGERETAPVPLGHRRRRRLSVHNRRFTPTQWARLRAAMRRFPEGLALLRVCRTWGGFGRKPIDGRHFRPSGKHLAVCIRGVGRSISGRDRRSSGRCFSKTSPAAAP